MSDESTDDTDQVYDALHGGYESAPEPQDAWGESAPEPRDDGDQSPHPLDLPAARRAARPVRIVG